MMKKWTVAFWSGIEWFGIAEFNDLEAAIAFKTKREIATYYRRLCWRIIQN